MKNIIILAVALFSAGLTVKGQSTGKIDLRIVDQQQKPSTQTFVELLNAKDSSLVQFATSDSKGNVEFQNLGKGNYLVFIPEIGTKSYLTYSFSVNNSDEYYDVTLTSKAHGEVVIVKQASKKVS
jgi:hypothetical protein